MADEQHRSDAELAAMEKGSHGPGVWFYEIGETPHYVDNFKALARIADALIALTGCEVFKDGDLTFGVRAGKFLNADAEVNYAGASGQALTDNQTNYIYLTAAGVLTVNTTGFPIPSVTAHIPLATIVTAGGKYSINDGDINGLFRQRAMLQVCGAGTGNLNALDWQESVADELDFTAAEPAGPTLGDRYLNTGTGASSVTGQTVAANDIEEWNGTNWTEITPTEGGCCLVEDRNMLILFNGASWVDIGTAALLNEAQTFFAATDISGAEAETLTDGSDADSLHTHKLLQRTVEANTAGVGAPNVLTAAESRKVLTNEDAPAMNYHELESAAAGLSHTFVVQKSVGMRIVAAAGDTIRLAGTVSIAGGYIESTTVGSTVILVAINATEWVAIAINGTWDVEIA